MKEEKYVIDYHDFKLKIGKRLGYPATNCFFGEIKHGITVTNSSNEEVFRNDEIDVSAEIFGELAKELVEQISRAKIIDNYEPKLTLEETPVGVKQRHCYVLVPVSGELEYLFFKNSGLFPKHCQHVSLDDGDDYLFDKMLSKVLFDCSRECINMTDKEKEIELAVSRSRPDVVFLFLHVDFDGLIRLPISYYRHKSGIWRIPYFFNGALVPHYLARVSKYALKVQRTKLVYGFEDGYYNYLSVCPKSICDSRVSSELYPSTLNNAIKQSLEILL